MKKRIIPVILILLFVSGVFPLKASAAVKSAGTETVLRSVFEKGGDVKLSKSLSLSDALVVPEGKKVSLDLNGKTLDRGMSVCSENGSAVIVMPGAVFTLKDTSGNNSGILKGGAALNGGGICNYGNTTVEGGTIASNKANDNTYGCGGGIYNGSKDGSAATLTVKGGILLKNRSRNGAGIYNGDGCTVTIAEGSYIKSIGNIQKTIIDNVQITENSASQHGGAIYNAGSFYLSGTPTIKENSADGAGEDVFSSAGRYLELNGELKSADKIVLAGTGNNPVAVNKYSTYNKTDAQTIFRTASTEEAIALGKNGEVIIKNTAKTIVQVFSGEKLTKWDEYDTVVSAWNAAKSSASSSNRVELILGSDWDKDERLILPNNSNIVIDLNGRYINRARNGKQVDDGEVIYVGDGATLTVKDSNPDRISYDGVLGGVITGGASGDGAGGVHVRPNATFNMYGGTIYKCTTDEHGGAILLKDNSKLNMKDCRIYYCQTIDSTDECHGGGIASNSGCTVNLDNVVFQDCYSEDSGGAVYLSDNDSGSSIKCIIKNCLFTGNIAEDFGGAVYLFLSKDASTFKTLNCTYRNNKAGSECSGGALYINGITGKSVTPIIVENCLITGNRAKWHGGGVFVGRPGVVLTDSTITDNYSALSGAVYVSEEVTLSLAGKMIIKDNSSPYNGKDLELADTNSSQKHTYFESAGLIEGSEIHFYRGDRGGVPVSRHISEFQTRYFIPEHGTMEFEPQNTIDTPVITASLFGDGSAVRLLLLAGAAVLAVLTAVIIKKRKGGARKNED